MAPQMPQPGMDGPMICPVCHRPMPMPDNRMGAPQEQMPPGQLGLNPSNANPMASGGAGGGAMGAGIPPELLMALLGGGGGGMGM